MRKEVFIERREIFNMRDALREIIIFAAGVGVGVGATLMLHKKRNRFEFVLDTSDSVEETNEGFYENALNAMRRYVGQNVEETVEEKQKISHDVEDEEVEGYKLINDWANSLKENKKKNEKVVQGAFGAKESESVSMKDVVEKGEENVLGRTKKDAPYLITEEEFDDPRYEDYEKIFLTYYADTDDLVDENDETAIINREVYVGTEFPFEFGTSEDPDFVHVRNDMMKLDFEIFRDYIQGDF